MRHLFIGLLLTAGLMLSLCESADGSLAATMLIKMSGVVCLGVVAVMTGKEEERV